MEAQRFGARLRQIRSQAGVTLRGLADKVGIDFTYLSKIENGVMPPPSEKVILQLAESLNADKDELLSLAGRIPSDISRLLAKREALRMARSIQRGQKILLASKEKRQSLQISGKNFFNKYGNLKTYGKLSKVAIPLVLVLAIAASLWFAAPVKALTIDIDNPSSGTLGSPYSYTVTVNVEDRDCLPIRDVDLYMYKSDDRSTYEAHCADLPLTDGATKDYSNADTGGGPVNITDTDTAAGWGYGYGYRYGYGYEITGGWGYYYFGYGRGYGYGYGGYTGTTSITYDVTWTPPSGWPAGGYKIEVKVKGNDKYFTQTSDEFTLYTPSVPPPAPPPPEEEEGVTDVSDVVTDEGVFTEDVTTESEDGMCELSIDEDTIGLTKNEEPLSEITIVEMEDPPDPPEDSNVIGLTYDFGPEGATFDPPITLTFTYDPSLIPEGVNEEDLVIAIWVWDEVAGKYTWKELSPCTVDPVTHTISGPVEHFTAFTVLAYTRPATFTTSDLSITPTEVDIRETVTISVVVANTGDLTGTYEVTLKIDNVMVATGEVTLAGGASQTVTFATSKDIAGTYAVTIDGLSGTFEVKVAPTPAPAAFVASDLSITPEEVEIGESVTISTLVANTGDLTGTYEVTLKIDNAVVATEEVTLTGGASQKVTFATSKDIADTYAVTIDGLSGTFEVKVAPTPAPAAFVASDLSITPEEVEIGESVTISTLVTNTGDLTGTYEVTLKIDNVVVATEEVTLAGGASQKVTFTISKDIAGTYAVTVDVLSGTFEVKVPPPKPIDWWLIGGIVAACIIIGLVISLVVRRRRA